MKNLDKGRNDKPKDLENPRNDNVEEDDVFSTEEIIIEEMAIDGICGVY